jgi:hypothetical protein
MFGGCSSPHKKFMSIFWNLLIMLANLKKDEMCKVPIGLGADYLLGLLAKCKPWHLKFLEFRCGRFETAALPLFALLNWLIRCNFLG